MIRVSVELVGRAAEAGERTLALELPDSATPADAAARLASQYPALEWLRRATKPAVNLEYTTWDHPLQDGDEVAFIPPVSGG
jgi:molybdopterin converting factor small subunit